MKPCSTEMQAINSLQIPFQPQINNSQFDLTSNDDFLDQILSSLPSSSWAEPITAFKSSPWDPRPDETASENGGGLHPCSHFNDESASILASKLRQHQISGTSSEAAARMMMMQQLLMSVQSDNPHNEIVDASSSFKPHEDHHQGGDAMLLYNGFISGQTVNPSSHFHQPQTHNFSAQGTVMNQNQPQPQPQVQAQAQIQASSSSGGQPALPRQRVRARRGQATDPHSIAERLRRERIAERMKALQELVPNGNKSDKASMLDEIIDYVKFLQLQVKVLSMSRLGGASAVAPLLTNMSSERGGGGGGGGEASSNGGSSKDSLTVTEHQVVKLMEEDMGSAMQYLQGKGLCLMPISLATAISSATCQSRNSIIHHHNSDGGEAPSSSSMSVLTVQSASMGNGATVLKDAASVSKP